jgi:hypothetical protein
VNATVTSSNVYAAPGGSWELRATSTNGGSRVEMIWVREFTSSLRGRAFWTRFWLIGNPLFRRYAHAALKNLTNLERPMSAHSAPVTWGPTG